MQGLTFSILQNAGCGVDVSYPDQRIIRAVSRRFSSLFRRSHSVQSVTKKTPAGDCRFTPTAVAEFDVLEEF